MNKIANLATKKDIGLLKTDIKKLDKRLTGAIENNQKAIEGNRREILGFKGEMDRKFIDHQEHTEKMVTRFKDEILRAIDVVMKEISAMREEFTIFGHQFNRHEEKIEDHETRITHLETPYSAS